MSITNESPMLPIAIGCPVWNCDQWSDIVYPAKTRKASWLNWYTRMFNTVEGNSSFYGIPALEHVERWAAESAEGFRFCFKFPREISHERALQNAQGPTREFMRVLEILAAADCLGPTFLQLGPDFAPNRKKALADYLDGLPKDFAWAVELRHHDWFDSGPNEQTANSILRDRGIDKVIFDSRALYQSPPDDEIERVSQSRKPRTPVRQTVTGKHPFLRLVGRNTIELADAYFSQWAPIVASWVEQGLRPYVFAHAPDDAFAPALARRFWERLRLDLKDPAMRDLRLPTPPAKPKQLELL